jgi:hypothetical protein
LDHSDNRTDYDDIRPIDAKSYCSIRRISVEGKRQTRYPINERKRPPGILERATPPLGYKLIEAPRSAAQKCGAKIKKKLEVDPVKAETVRLISKPYLLGDGSSGALGNVDQEFSDHDEIVCRHGRFQHNALGVRVLALVGMQYAFLMTQLLGGAQPGRELPFLRA